MLSTRHLIDAAGMAAALLVMALVLYGSWAPFGVPVPASDGAADRLALALRWMLAPAMCMLAGLGGAHLQRMFNPLASDGQREGAGRFFEIVQRYNINTLEQCFLALIAWCGLALIAPADKLVLIPRLAVLFSVGRVLFFWGYVLSPRARIFGMGLTAYPTYGVLIWLVWRVFQPV